MNNLGESITERIEVLAAAAEGLRKRLTCSGHDPLLQEIALESGLAESALERWLVPWTGRLGDIGAMARLVATSQALRGGRQQNMSPPRPPRILTLAPGNIPIVATECLLLTSLANCAHDLCLSRRATALALAFHAELRTCSTELASRTSLHVWRRLTLEERERLLQGAGRVVLYGTAETVDRLAAELGGSSPIVPHGPSLGITVADAPALRDDEQLLLALAKDVCAFDQRGCRSPQYLFVVGSASDAEMAARTLAGHLAEESPARGQLTEAERVSGYLDTLTSRALGRVFTGPQSCVTMEYQPRVLRPSPLGRTLRVVGVPTMERIPRLLQTLMAPVGLVATARPASLHSLGWIPTGTEVCEFGQMQTPHLDHSHDGRHRLDELLGGGV